MSHLDSSNMVAKAGTVTCTAVKLSDDVKDVMAMQLLFRETDHIAKAMIGI